MQRVITLPAEGLPAKVAFNPAFAMNDDEYFAFCVANRDVCFERTAEGAIAKSIASTHAES